MGSSQHGVKLLVDRPMVLALTTCPTCNATYGTPCHEGDTDYTASGVRIPFIHGNRLNAVWMKILGQPPKFRSDRFYSDLHPRQWREITDDSPWAERNNLYPIKEDK